LNASPCRRRSASKAGASLLSLTLLLAGIAALAQAGDADNSLHPATPLMMRSLYLDGDAIGDHMVVVGERGHILVSRDGGKHWMRAESPTESTLTGVTLHESGLGWAVGHDAVILRTEDGGETWATVHAAPEEERPLLDVWFENAEHGVAIGAYGYVLQTTDGGETWHTHTIADTDRHLNHITAAPSGHIYVAAESGKVFRSDDGATTWSELAPPYAGSFFGTLPVDGEHVYVYGLRGHLFYTDDAGASWQALDTGTASLLTGGLALEDGRLVFTGMGGIILSGPDKDGVVRQIRRSDRASLAGALPASDGALITFGEFGIERMPAGRFGPTP